VNKIKQNCTKKIKPNFFRLLSCQNFEFSPKLSSPGRAKAPPSSHASYAYDHWEEFWLVSILNEIKSHLSSRRVDLTGAVHLDSSLSGALSVHSSCVSVHLKLIDAVRPQVSNHGRRQWTVIDVQHSTCLLQRVSHVTHRRVVDTIASHHAYTRTHVCAARLALLLHKRRLILLLFCNEYSSASAVTAEHVHTGWHSS